MSKMSKKTPRDTCSFHFVALKCVFLRIKKKKMWSLVIEAIPNSFVSFMLL